MNSPWCTITALEERPDSKFLDQLRNFPTAMVSDCLGRIHGAVSIQPYYSGKAMIGPAFTVKTRPGDNLMVHKALDLAEPGDIIVVDAGGDLSNAIVGDLMMTYAIRRELGGFVIGGAIRDVSAFRKADFPCFAQGNVHRGPYKDGPGQINVPVSIGGMVVRPGDVVMGDEDGVLTFPATGLDGLLHACVAKMAQENADRAAIIEGFWDRPWVDAIIQGRPG
jgi:regulator of RNase E activity RraA